MIFLLQYEKINTRVSFSNTTICTYLKVSLKNLLVPIYSNCTRNQLITVFGRLKAALEILMNAEILISAAHVLTQKA